MNNLSIYISIQTLCCGRLRSGGQRDWRVHKVPQLTLQLSESKELSVDLHINTVSQMQRQWSTPTSCPQSFIQYGVEEYSVFICVLSAYNNY